MKITLNPQRAKRASTMLVTVLVAIACGSVLAYVLAGSQSEYVAVQRSQDWNNALDMADAGVEEAMTLINNGGWPNNTTYSSDGWSLNGNVYSITRVLDSKIGSYTVYVTNTSLVPVICSMGKAYSQNANMASNNITRTVVVKAINTSPFPGALTLQSTVDMNGKGVTVDSYDSTDSSKSYWTVNGYGVYTNNGVGYNAKRQANGNVATDAAVINVITIGNGNIYGKVNTGPGGTASLGSQGSVGDTSWVGSNTGIQPGYSQSDMNVSFPAVNAPSTNWTTKANNATITNSGNYAMDQVSGDMSINGGTNKIYVTILITNGISLSGSSTLTVGSNTTVTMYVGKQIVLSGNGDINSVSQHPVQMIIYGLSSSYGFPSLDTLTLNGNGAFWGAIYAPDAVVNFNGSGSSGGFYGALTAYSIKMNGTSTFSYDESLGRFGTAGYTITSWKEIY